MNELDQLSKSIYEKINLYAIAERVSEQYRFENRLEKFSIEVILEIIKSYEYNVRFVKKEGFFRILEKKHGYDFYFHLSLKYGLVEIIFGAIDKDKKHITGGTISTICKLIEIDNGVEKDGYMKYPGFRNYDDLNSILKVYFKLYEDFKREVIKEYLKEE